MEAAGAGWLAEALTINSSLTRVYFFWDLNTRCLINAHLDRNKGNLEKKSALLFLMLLNLLDGEEHFSSASFSLDVFIAVEDHHHQSNTRRNQMLRFDPV